MTLGIFANKTQHRFDSPTKPAITFVDHTVNTKLFIRDYLYFTVEKPNYIWSPPNRTDYPLSISAREMTVPAWTLSGGISQVIYNFTKTATEGFSGATADTVPSGDCSIEGAPGNFSASTVIALQSGTASFDYVRMSVNFLTALCSCLASRSNATPKRRG